MKKAGTKDYSRIRLGLNIYIAIVITVLGVKVFESVGTNTDQNRRIAQQARAIAKTSQNQALAGCQRGNFVRSKINTISGALTKLLEKSVAENEKRGIELTGEQSEFLESLYKELRPLKAVGCKQKYSGPLGQE